MVSSSGHDSHPPDQCTVNSAAAEQKTAPFINSRDAPAERVGQRETATSNWRFSRNKWIFTGVSNTRIDGQEERVSHVLFSPLSCKENTWTGRT
jgi:hypothetical protein